MSQSVVVSALARLRAAADGALFGFPQTVWHREAGPGPDTLVLDGGGVFHGLTLEPGRELVISSKLDLPASVQGVPLSGDPLEATILSLYPATIEWNGEVVYSEGGVPVAAGPCLIALIPELKAGDNGVLRITAHVPRQQTTTWFHVRLSTPGLRMRFEKLDVAWAQLAWADAIAMTPNERALVEKAAHLVPETLPEDDASLTPILSALAETLMPLDARAKSIEVHCIGHSHIDMNWLWTWEDTKEVIKRDFRTVLQLMDEFPELTFSHSQPATYEVVRQEEPELFERVLQRIREGRWEPLTMTWVEGDVNMASGEAHARQLLEGVRYSRDVLGYEPTTFHAPDTFGHAANLPQMAVSAGAQRYYHHRANAGGVDQYPAYWWEGADGTRLLGISTPSYNGEIYARDLVAAAMRARRHGHPCAMHFHGIGDHGGGPSRQNLQALRRFQQTPLLPSARCSTTAAYTRALLDSGVPLPVHKGESTTIFEGCYTTHADTKRYNRMGENLLCTADALTAVAGIATDPALQQAWRTVCFNQFHDILDGSAIHEVYEKNRADFEEVESVAQQVISRATMVLAPQRKQGFVTVVNPLGWEREDVVFVPGVRGKGAVLLADPQGRTTVGQYVAGGLVFVAHVPAFGATPFRVLGPAEDIEVLEPRPAYAPADGRPADTPEAAATAPYLRVDTPFYTAYVRRDCGILVGFYDKRVGRELVAFGMRKPADYMDTARPDLALNVFQFMEELPHAMSAWELQEVATVRNLITGAATRVMETGPVQCVLEVKHRIRRSTITQHITFYRSLPRVDFETTVDWREIGDSARGVPGLKVAFTASMPECEAWFETPYAAVQRPSNGQEVPALRWADIGGNTYGFALLNDCKYGYDAMGCRLRLTLIRSGYDPDAISDVGRHVFRYSFLPHPGNWRDAGVVRAGYGFNQPLIGLPNTRPLENTAFFAPQLSDAGSALVTALKPSMDDPNRVVIRVVETAGRHVAGARLRLKGAHAVWLANIVEDILSPVPLHDEAVHVQLRPWEVRTYIAEVSCPCQGSGS